MKRNGFCGEYGAKIERLRIGDLFRAKRENGYVVRFSEIKDFRVKI